MSDRYFVDTNILIYAHDTAAGVKHERAKALIEGLWRERSGVVSTQVLQELAVNLRRKAGRPLDVKATREVIADYLSWQVVVNGGDSILGALELEERFGISFWDALIIHAAQASGAEVLYSENLSDRQQHGGLRVVKGGKRQEIRDRGTQAADVSRVIEGHLSSRIVRSLSFWNQSPRFWERSEAVERGDDTSRHEVSVRWVPPGRVAIDQLQAGG